MAGNYQVVQDFFTLMPSGTQYLDIDRYNFSSLILLITQSYPAPGSPLGTVVTIYDGFGPGDPLSSGGLPTVLGGSSVPVFNTTGRLYILSTGFTTDGSNQYSSTSIRFVMGDDNQCARWLRLKFYNTDPFDKVRLKIYGDI